jgi:hypothetical protein
MHFNQKTEYKVQIETRYKDEGAEKNRGVKGRKKRSLKRL